MTQSLRILIAGPHYFTSTCKVGGHQYAMEFVRRGFLVAYIGNPLSPFHFLFSKDRQDVNQRKQILRSGGSHAHGVWHYVPLTFVPHHNNVPLLKHSFFLKHYHHFFVPPIQAVLKKARFEDVDLLWIDTPAQNYWCKLFPRAKIVYRVYDNLFAFKETSKAIEHAHQTMLEKADLVLVTSKLLMEQKEYDKHKQKVFHCPNGVNLTNFKSGSTFEKPKELQQYGSRDIGLYVGAVHEWFDFDFLNTVATLCNDVVFIIIGPVKYPPQQQLADNIVLLGPRNYEEVPRYIQWCTFGIIPFKNTDLITYVNPIKLYEFAAMGKPTISRTWPELERISPPAYLVKSPHHCVEIIKSLGGSTKSESALSSNTLITFAQNNTWEKRVDFVLQKAGIANSTHDMIKLENPQ